MFWALLWMGCSPEPKRDPIEVPDITEAPEPPLSLAGVPGQIIMTVIDEAGPVVGASVEVRQDVRSFGYATVAVNALPIVGVTDASGRFTVDPFATGVYDSALSVPEALTRVEVRHEGHDPAVFYRELRYDLVCASTFGGVSEVGCTEWTLGLIPSDAKKAELLPDMFVDESTLSDCQLVGAGEDRQLLVSVGTPNGGQGPADVRSVVGSEVVRQRIWKKNGKFREKQLDGAAFVFEGHEDHDHFHFENWTWMRLLDLDGAEIRKGNKISFCLIDLGMWDTEIYNEVWGEETQYGCGVVGNEIQQGLSPGMFDVYGKGVEGQAVNIDGVPPGQYWLEYIVDPLGFLDELDKTNNAARVLIELPEEGSEITNPCVAPYLPPLGGSDTGIGEEPDFSSYLPATLVETCSDLPGAAALTEGHWTGSMALDANTAWGAGEDGWAKVVVPAGQTLTVSAEIWPGDTMLALDTGCGQPWDEEADLGATGAPESVSWTNSSAGDVTVNVLVDNWSTGTQSQVFGLDVHLDP